MIFSCALRVVCAGQGGPAPTKAGLRAAVTGDEKRSPVLPEGLTTANAFTRALRGESAVLLFFYDGDVPGGEG